jgi:hypothetical protein
LIRQFLTEIPNQASPPTPAALEPREQLFVMASKRVSGLAVVSPGTIGARSIGRTNCAITSSQTPLYSENSNRRAFGHPGRHNTCGYPLVIPLLRMSRVPASTRATFVVALALELVSAVLLLPSYLLPHEEIIDQSIISDQAC